MVDSLNTIGFHNYKSSASSANTSSQASSGLFDDYSQYFSSQLSSSSLNIDGELQELEKLLLVICSDIMQLIEGLTPSVNSHSGNSLIPNANNPNTKGTVSGSGASVVPSSAKSAPASSSVTPTSSNSTSSGTTSSGTTSQESTSTSSSNSTNVTKAAVDGGGPNHTILKNNTGKAMKVAFFENTASGMHPDLDKPTAVFTLQPNQTIDVSMPDSWQGRVQKWSGNASDPATWAELNYQSANGKTPYQTWFDESLIQGYNGAMTITPTSGGKSAGSSTDLVNGAPADLVVTDAAGNKTIKQTQPYSNGGATNQEAVNYYNKTIGNSNAYVLPDDNNAVRMTSDRSLTIDFDS